MKTNNEGYSREEIVSEIQRVNREFTEKKDWMRVATEVKDGLVFYLGVKQVINPETWKKENKEGIIKVSAEGREYFHTETYPDLKTAKLNFSEFVWRFKDKK